jgi:hypothetical protein
MPSSSLLALLLLSALALIAAGVWIAWRVRRNAGDRERRRRLEVNARGRLGEATITDISGDIVYYSYTVHAVVYEGSQDISQLRSLIHVDPQRMIGPVSMKYSPRNPANSIVICEEWSGLRGNSRQ